MICIANDVNNYVKHVFVMFSGQLTEEIKWGGNFVDGEHE